MNALLESPVTVSSVEKPQAISPAQQEQILTAQRCMKRLQRAGRIALFNGWTLALIAVFSVPFALSSIVTALTVVAASVLAYFELLGRRRLLALDPKAASMLGWNQLALLACIVAYCAWMLYQATCNPAELAAKIGANRELSQVVDSAQIAQLYQLVTWSVYGGVLVASLLFQGANAWYYFSRGRIVAQIRDETPGWVLDLQQQFPTAK